MALTAFGKIRKWNVERNLLKTPEDFNIANEASFIIEELIEGTKDIESSKARKWAKKITWLLMKVPGVNATREMMVDAYADIIVFAVGAIYKLGYDTDKVMKEVQKEIDSRKGKIVDGKFEKDKSPEAKANWYKADFTKCLS